MNGTELWITCIDGRAVLRWQEGLSFDEAEPVLRLIKRCRSLANVSDLVPLLEERTRQKVSVANFPTVNQKKRAA